MHPYRTPAASTRRRATNPEHALILRRVPAACQGKSCDRKPGFTLVELLAVIVIIGILASVLAVALTKARSLARQADCKSNMRQLGAAILIYRSDNSGSNPAWLSCLYPNYVDDLHLFVCRSDPAFGKGNCYPATLTPLVCSDNSNYDTLQIADNDLNNCPIRTNAVVHACSYFYEFSKAPSPWKSTGNPNVTLPASPSYQDYKIAQLQYGDIANGYVTYSTSRMPIIRCYQHINEGSIRGHVRNSGDGSVTSVIQTFPITINVAYAGNVYVGPLWWEGALKPGEQ